ncbi:Succinate--CoA ligase (ADP-forming) [Solidesulfovibrio carbinoliphilus subsp. oakridgensis]|uniref:Succinate--CoA ligase (ADP-forming) n=1 Tax=Solidesulfovibrio carbinoliphilus subsp. oakridgensis TaxID=694327 RepID=G7QC16_9BACT|nr:ATP-grasp domain-containing protein [Solidesulfovibrio carbinoliphilus]EHJ46051.1 Succinate--CoA ligase (ADP-forming) [Solidesulfovibrio carbinoliphilus subsp. oakridgensis]
MLLTEHAGKALFAEAGIETPPGLALGPGEAAGFVPPFAAPWYLKAQTLSGGRGKAGGVVRLDDPAGLEAAAEGLFGLSLGGQTPPFLRLEPVVPFDRAVYLSLGVSRERKALCLTVARQGGVDVEGLAGSEELLVLDVPPPFALTPRLGRAAFFHLGLEPERFEAFFTLLSRLFAAVDAYGLLLAEINPLAVTPDGRFVALDAKVVVDDHAVCVTPALARFGDDRFATPSERRAVAHKLSFVSLAGRVGLVANGAGLAMATMDALDTAGLSAANFLDFGGAADAPRLTAAFDLIFADPNVTACCVNMYGGILSCLDVAEALAVTLADAPPPRPVVVRFAGNGATAGAARLRRLGLPSLLVAGDMDEAMALLSEIVPVGPRRPLSIPLAEACRDRPAVAPTDAGMARRTTPSLPSLLDLDQTSGVLVQGLTGRAGRLHARRMVAGGTNVACGVTPFRGGTAVDGIPVYGTVAQAVRHHDIALSVLFVPAPGAADAVLEAAEAGIRRIVCITDGVPQKDMLAVRTALAGQGTLLLGPNTPGLCLPGRMQAGIMPGEPFSPGPVAVFSRSGTLAYEVCSRLTAAGIGQAVVAGIGGDPFGGAGFVELCEMVRHDERVRAVMVVGEVGGYAEEDLAAHVAATGYPKPVAAFVAGLTAPPGRTLGHAGALLDRPGGITEKLACLARAGIAVCPELGDVAGVMAGALCGA